MKIVLVLTVFISFLHNSSSLECYTCFFSEQDTDSTCVDNPIKLGEAGKTNCNKKYCTTIRQEYKDPDGKLASMYRGCEDQPLSMNKTIEDQTYRFYFTACQYTLCNGNREKSSEV